MANAESQSEADSLPQYDVFLSHAGYDGGQKLETSILHDKLKDYVKVFFDRDSLKPGKRKAVHRMVHAVATAKVIVVILSPEYLCREWCLRELEVALARAEENKVFKKGKSFSEFLKERFHEDELSEVKEVQNIDEIPAIIIPVFHSLSPHQCRNLRDVLDGFPTVKEKFTDWYFNDSPITKKRWELALKEISKHVGLEFFQRAVPWKENADRIRDTVFQNLGVAVPVRRENPAETPKKKLVPSIPPLERHWSNTLYGSELEKIVDYLCGTKSLLLSGIVGCGGVGKTVLGIQVVHNDKIKTHFKTIFYLRAGHDADSQNLLLQWYQQIRKTDYLGETNLSEEKLKQSILSHGLENVLVIVDNVWKQKCIGAIRKILRHSKTSRMLITTQLRNLLPLGTSKKFTVEPVSADAGLHFLKERAGEDWNQEWSDNDARKLVKKTGGVVLFMSLVAGLLDHRKIDALDLIIEELDEKGSDIHKFHRGAFAKEIKTYGATGLACLQLSIDSLKDERQRNRYIMLGVFPLAISSIPVESLKEIWKIDTINDTKRTADVYESRSLLQRNGDFISLHELQRKYLGEVYQEYSREQKNGFPIDESTIGYAFFDGAYKLDEVMYRQVLSLREKTLGEEHPDTLRTKGNLAGVLDNQGNYKEAEVMYRQVLSLREKTLGEEGYQEDFLGANLRLGLTSAKIDCKAPCAVISHTHFTLLFREDHRIVWLAGANINRTPSFRDFERSRSRSYDFDPNFAPTDPKKRPEDLQYDEYWYRNGSSDPYDQGHMVRRNTIRWADPRETDAQSTFSAAERDSDYWTNIAPHHSNFHHDEWAKVEAAIVHLIDNYANDFKGTVFTGSWFDPDGDHQKDDWWDPKERKYDPTKTRYVPDAYFKIVVFKFHTDLLAFYFWIDHSDGTTWSRNDFDEIEVKLGEMPNTISKQDFMTKMGIKEENIPGWPDDFFHPS